MRHDKDKVGIQINQHSLTVKGQRSRQEKEQNANRYISSDSFGSFVKTIPLPDDADTTRVRTEKKGDTLVIELPKKGR